MNSFRQINKGDSYYLAEKADEVEGLSNWDALAYLRSLDEEHRWFVADTLGLRLADLESALKLYSAVWNGRAMPVSDELRARIDALGFYPVFTDGLIKH